MDLHPGMVIAGRYRIDTKVGAGGMGEVWAGEHVTVGSKVALKTLLPAAAVNHEVVARFKREAYFLGRIRSEHVARVVDFVADDAIGLVLVMEYIEGEPLSKVLQKRRLSVEEAIELGVDIVTALRDLHAAKIIHRDLKPGNIIMQSRPGGGYRAVIVDFGVSRAVSGGSEDEEMTGITRADMAVGTIEYMAPEQILNSRDVIAASDIYAVGAILFRAVAGQHIFGDVYDAELAKMKLMTDPPPLRTGRQDRVAKGLEEVVAKAIKRPPKQRYDHADKILHDLVVLRDLARVAAIELDETTHEVTGASISIVVDPVSSPSVTRPRLSQTGGPVSSGPASAQPTSSATPSAPVRSSAPEEVSVTAPSAPAPRAGSRESLTGAESFTPREPRRRGIPMIATVALVLVALAGGAGLGSTGTPRKRAGLAGAEAPATAPAEPVETAAPAQPSAQAPSAPTAADTGAAPDDDMVVEAAVSATAAAPSAPAIAAAPTQAAVAAPTAPRPAGAAPSGAPATPAPKPTAPASAAGTPATAAPAAPATTPTSAPA
ncbi:MAG: protein kinase, partial [Polyangiaceae bacterium]|nr:protein kinase [Polyangiaceae bacterium]